MENIKQFLTKYSEYYLVVLAFLSGYTPPFNVSAIAIGLMAILILQIISKNRVTGLVIASLFILANLYMLLALVSEFNEFPSFNADAKQLLLVGSAIFIFNLVMAGAMILKYAQGADQSRVQVKADN